jgi:hypothetical protein
MFSSKVEEGDVHGLIPQLFFLKGGKLEDHPN